MDFTIVFHLRIISGSSETSFESTNNIFQKSAEGLYPLPGDSGRILEKLASSGRFYKFDRWNTGAGKTSLLKEAGRDGKKYPGSLRPG